MTKDNKLINKLRYKYKLSISNEDTFENLFSIRLSKLNLISISISFVLIIAILATIAIAFTDLKEFIPGYDRNLRKKIVNNAITLDSLKMELNKRDKFFISIQKVINGEDKSDITSKIDKNRDTSKVNARHKMNFKTSEDENKFRSQIEEEEKFNLLVNNEKKKDKTNLQFFPPIKGLISQNFDTKIRHYGTDIVAKTNSRISSVLDGTIIFTGWTIKTGYVIQVQHSNGFISLYKHNAELLKKTGVQVKAGEAIAILGNTGELTSSSHLHFELWKSGKPVNPETYINFK